MFEVEMSSKSKSLQIRHQSGDIVVHSLCTYMHICKDTNRFICSKPRLVLVWASSVDNKKEFFLQSFSGNCHKFVFLKG